MSKKHSPLLCLIIISTIFLGACAAEAAPVTASAVPAQPTTAPAATAAEHFDASSIKAGLVTAAGGENDQVFNQLAWEGVQKAAAEMGFQAKILESAQPTDYEANIDALAAEDCNVIITIGASMSEATAQKARQYPDIKFAIVDHAYYDENLPNVTSLMFAEEQVGFLAGVLAGGMSRSGFVCSISSIKNDQSQRYMISFFQGASWLAGPEMKFMNNYINIQTTDDNVPSSSDSTLGKETALRLIGSGCDVVFGIGGGDVNGALLAAGENNLPAIGDDVDRYNTYPEARSALISSVMKNVDVAVYHYLKAVADGSARTGVITGNLQNGGVGLAPFHDWESKIPADLKAKIQLAGEGIMDGSIKIDLPPME